MKAIEALDVLNQLRLASQSSGQNHDVAREAVSTLQHFIIAHEQQEPEVPATKPEPKPRAVPKPKAASKSKK